MAKPIRQQLSSLYMFMGYPFDQKEVGREKFRLKAVFANFSFRPQGEGPCQLKQTVFSKTLTKDC